MNTKFFASALIAATSLASVSAFAAGADNPLEPRQAAVTSMARADVRVQSPVITQGAVTASNQVDGSTLRVAPRDSQRSRDDVRAEAVQRNGGMAYGNAAGRS